MQTLNKSILNKMYGVSVCVACALLVNVWSKPLSFSSNVAVPLDKEAHAVPVKEEVHEMLGQALAASGQKWPSLAFGNAVGAITDVVETYHFSPAFVLGVIQTESSFQLNAVSAVGAVGLTQIMPSTADEVAKRAGDPPPGGSQLFEAGTNIRLGFGYLAHLRDRYGSIEAALAAYNAGPALLRHNKGPSLPMDSYRRDVWNSERMFARWMKSP